jgi:hypothetical protein
MQYEAAMLPPTTDMEKLEVDIAKQVNTPQQSTRCLHLSRQL